MDDKKLISEMEAVLEISPGTMRREELVRQLHNWDSMKLLEIMALADNDFHVHLDAEQLALCKTVGDILDLIASQSS